MEYRIDMTDSAFADAEKSFLYYKKDSEDGANIWFKGLVEAVNSLKTFPNRCPLIPETRSFFIEFRQLLYGKGARQHRIIFGISVDEKTSENVVTIYRIRHGLQNYLSDLEILGEKDEE